MAQVARHFLKRHAVVDQKRRCAMADAMRAKAAQAPAADVVAAGQHERDRIHRERPRFTASVREEEPAWIVVRGGGGWKEGGSTALEEGEDRGCSPRLKGEI